MFRTVSIIILVAQLLLATCTSFGQCESRRIISNLSLPAKTFAKPSGDPSMVILNSRKVKFDINLLLKKSLGIKLNGRFYRAERSSKYSASNSSKLNSTRYTKTVSGKIYKPGRIEMGTYFVSLFYSKKTKRSTIAASFRTPENKEYSISGYSKGKKHNLTLRQLKYTSNNGLQCEQNSQGYTDSSITELKDTFVNYTGTPTLKVLVAYTPDALAKAGGTLAGIQAIVNFEIARMNQALQDSAINLIVENACTPYAVATSRYDDISDVLAFYENGDGWADGVHQARLNCGADLVHLMYGGTTGGGYGNLLSSAHSLARGSRQAYSGNFINYFLSPTSKGFAHELGHNLGCAHHVDYSQPGIGYYPDSHGHRFTGTNNITYTDIMTYVYSVGESVNLFANPNITYQGTPTGVLGSADLARTLNVTGSIATQFRNYLTPASGTLGFRYLKYVSSGAMYVIPELNLSNTSDLTPFEIKKYYKDSQNNWVYDGSITNVASPYPLNVDPTKTYKMDLYPDIFISTSEITPITASSMNVNANLNNNVISGNIIDNQGSPIRISGTWLRLKFRFSFADPSTPFETITTLTTDNNGNFSYNLTTPGHYILSFVTESSEKTSQIFVYTASATATPTFTATAIPTISNTPTRTATAVPTLTATNTFTPSTTYTNTPQPTPPITATPTPTVVNTPIPTINVPTSVPVSTPTPTGGNQYSLTIKQTKLGRTKVLLSGFLYQDGNPIALTSVKLKCNKPKTNTTAKTNNDGKYNIIRSRPIVNTLSCYIEYKQFRSSTVRITSSHKNKK